MEENYQLPWGPGCAAPRCTPGRHRRRPAQEDLLLLRLIDEEYTRHFTLLGDRYVALYANSWFRIRISPSNHEFSTNE
jgi:hypothetical protein